jgi:toxin-antitoxin system PIN domain toxin
VVVVDANLLLYAVNRSSPQHRIAKAWLDDALSGREVVGFAWTVILAFIRLATHPRVFPSPLEPSDAVDIVRTWLAQPTAVIVEPDERHLDVLGSLLTQLGSAANLVGDAHLAALALERDGRIASFDTDFARFPDVRLEELEAD